MHDPHEPNPHMGIPANKSEMEEFTDERKYMRAEDHTEEAYVKYLSQVTKWPDFG